MAVCTIAQAESPANPAPHTAVSAKLLRYAEYVVRKHDANKSGRLESEEWLSMRGQPELADSNQDGAITVNEYAQYCADYGAGRAIRLSTLPGELASRDGTSGSDHPEDTRPSDTLAATGEAGAELASSERDRRRDTKYFASLPQGVPQWFVRRDADGDGQLTLSEYSPKLIRNEVEDFNRYDANRDGILTVAEFVRAGKVAQAKAPATAASGSPPTGGP